MKDGREFVDRRRIARTPYFLAGTISTMWFFFSYKVWYCTAACVLWHNSSLVRILQDIREQRFVFFVQGNSREAEPYLCSILHHLSHCVVSQA